MKDFINGYDSHRLEVVYLEKKALGFCVAGTFLTQGFTWPLYILLAFTVALSHFVSNFKRT